jgi:hypothetical protein
MVEREVSRLFPIRPLPFAFGLVAWLKHRRAARLAR